MTGFCMKRNTGLKQFKLLNETQAICKMEFTIDHLKKFTTPLLQSVCTCLWLDKKVLKRQYRKDVKHQ